VSDPEKAHIPAYLKLIIALCTLGFIGLIVVVVMGVSLIKKNFAPDNAVKVAHELVDLPDPLPPGWHYGVGLDIGYQKVVNLQYMHHNRPIAMVQFIEVPKNSHVLAKDMVAKIALPSVGGMKFESQGQGEEIIAGKKAYYVRTHTTMMGKDSAGEIALLDLPGERILEIQSTEQDTDKFDPALIKPLLDSVKGFCTSNQ
jgi:hypothetical protein